MIPHGEQDSAKTSISNGVKYMIDPEIENSLSMPEDVDDIAVTMSKREISSFDNIDQIKKIVSDFLCRVVTGTQHPKRKLYTDGDEFNLILKEKFKSDFIPHVSSWHAMISTISTRHQSHMAAQDMVTVKSIAVCARCL
jgi:hypothetical protein